MTNAKRTILAAVTLAMTAIGTEAAPVTPHSSAVPAAAEMASVTPVQYRGYRGGYNRSWRGPGIGLGIGAGLVAGAIIANQAYRPRAGYYYDTYDYDGPYYYPSEYRGDPRRICAEHFRSFEWRTGLYTTYGGEKRMCPYLR
jgi:hypothetical protein